MLEAQYCFVDRARDPLGSPYTGRLLNVSRDILQIGTRAFRPFNPHSGSFPFLDPCQYLLVGHYLASRHCGKAFLHFALEPIIIGTELIHCLVEHIIFGEVHALGKLS